MGKQEFNVGDKVRVGNSKGTVTLIDENEPVYPVFVKFTNGFSASYTFDGKYLEFGKPSLFLIEKDDK